MDGILWILEKPSREAVIGRQAEFSVARLCEISPLWQNFKSSLAIIECVYIVFGKIFNLPWQIFGKGANFNCSKWPNVKKII